MAARLLCVALLLACPLVRSRDPPAVLHPVHGGAIPDAWAPQKRQRTTPSATHRLLFILQTEEETAEMLPVLEALSVEDEISFKTVALGPAAKLLRDAEIGAVVLCSDEASAEASILTRIPEVALIGMSTPAQLQLSKVLHTHGSMIVGFHSNFFAPPAVAFQMLPFLHMLLLPHQDVRAAFGTLPPQLQVRVTGSPAMERLQLEHGLLLVQTSLLPTSQGQNHPDLDFLADRHVGSAPLLTFFDRCEAAPAPDPTPSGSSALGDSGNAAEAAEQEAALRQIGERNRLSALSREGFFEAAEGLGTAVTPVLHVDGPCPLVFNHSSGIILAPRHVAAPLMMSVSSLVVSSTATALPVTALFVGVAGVYLQPDAPADALGGVFAVSRGLVPVCRSVPEFLSTVKGTVQGTAGLRGVTPHKLRAARVVPHATQLTVDVLLHLLLAPLLEDGGTAEETTPQHDFRMETDMSERHPHITHAQAREAAELDSEVVGIHLHGKKRHRTQLKWVPLRDRRAGQGLTGEWESLSFMAGMMVLLTACGLLMAYYCRCDRCRKKTHPL